MVFFLYNPHSHYLIRARSFIYTRESYYARNGDNGSHQRQPTTAANNGSIYTGEDQITGREAT